MESYIYSFEKELRERVNLKSRANRTEQKVMIKAFKYFDLRNTGIADFKQFKKTIEKLGVFIQDENELVNIFQFYDRENTGKINYKIFTDEFYSKTAEEVMTPQQSIHAEDPISTRSNQKLNTPIPRNNYLPDPQNDLKATVERLRENLRNKGRNSILLFGRIMKRKAKDDSRTLDIEQFANSFFEYRIDIADWEIKQIFDFFDSGQNNYINCDEFLLGIRGPMNEKRRRSLANIFNKADSQLAGFIPLDKMRQLYRADNLDEVVMGKMLQTEAMEEFFEGIDTYYTLKGFKDGKMTREEFEEFYSFVSPAFKNDDDFDIFIRSAWGLMNNAKSHRSNRSNRSRVSQRSHKVHLNNYEVQSGISYKSNRSRPISRHESMLDSEKSLKTQPEKRRREEISRLEGGAMKKKTAPAMAHISAANPLVMKMRKRLNKRGAIGYIGLMRQFHIMDDDQNDKIDFQEFCKAMKDYRLEFPPNEVNALFNIVEVDKEQRISISEFRSLLIGNMNDRRKALTQKCFEGIDNSHKGHVTINQIKQYYTSRRHPDVISGLKGQDEVLAEFGESFEIHHLLNCGGKTHRVSLEEFMSYFENVSIVYEKDKDFESMMKNAWRVPLNAKSAPETGARYNIGNYERNPVYNVRPQKVVAPYGVDVGPTNYSTTFQAYKMPIEEEEKKKIKKQKVAGISSWPGRVPRDRLSEAHMERYEGIMNRVRDTLITRGIRGFLGLNRILRVMDDDFDGYVNFYEFFKALNDSRLYFTEEEVSIVFEYFDRDEEQQIYSDQFLKILRGRMPEHREMIVERAYEDLLKKSESGQVDLEEIRVRFNPNHHPDAESGRRTEEQVLNDFLESFENHHALWTNDMSLKEKVVDKEEFLEFYDILSAVNKNDLYFEQMASKVWVKSRNKKVYRPLYR